MHSTELCCQPCVARVRKYYSASMDAVLGESAQHHWVNLPEHNPPAVLGLTEELELTQRRQWPVICTHGCNDGPNDALQYPEGTRFHERPHGRADRQIG